MHFFKPQKQIFNNYEEVGESVLRALKNEKVIEKHKIKSVYVNYFVVKVLQNIFVQN